MEGIERDRAILRKMRRMDKDSLENAYLESLKDKKISYIPNLLASSKSDLLAEKYVQTGNMSLKIKTMTTKNILFAVSEAFRKINKKTIRKLDGIKEELSRREDLFECILDHMETIDSLEDDLFSWYPGLKTCDIFSFFLDLVPDLLGIYKAYFVKSLALRQPPKKKILAVFKDRLGKSLQCFEVIEKDLVLFEEVSRDAIEEGQVITSSYWTCDNHKCTDALRLFPHIKSRVHLTTDIYAELFHPLSYAEVLVNGRELLVSFVQLDDLMTRNSRSLGFWMQAGVVDESWEYI